MQEESKNEELETQPGDAAESASTPEPAASEPSAESPEAPSAEEPAPESAETPDASAEAGALPGADQDDSLQSGEAAAATQEATAEGAEEGETAEPAVAAPADEAPLVADELAPQPLNVTDTTSEQPDGQVEQTPEDLAAESQAIDPKIDIGLLEAYLFSTHSPLTGGKLAELFNLESTKPIRKAVRLLNEQYEQTGRCFRVEQVAGGFQLLTLPTYGEPLKALHQKEQDAKLTKAALETLAIVAYKQPILRADVEAIRGVASGETIRSLMEKHLVKIAGRAEEPGRPILYGTTKRFLEVFGLNSLKDLPQPDALQAKAQQQLAESAAAMTPAPAAELAPAQEGTAEAVPEEPAAPAPAPAETAEAAESPAEPAGEVAEVAVPASADELTEAVPADVEAATTEGESAEESQVTPESEPAPASEPEAEVTPAEQQPAEETPEQTTEEAPAEGESEPPANQEEDPDRQAE